MYSGVDGLEGRKVRGSVATLKLLKNPHHTTQQQQPMKDDDAGSTVILHSQLPEFLR